MDAAENALTIITGITAFVLIVTLGWRLLAKPFLDRRNVQSGWVE